MYHPHSARAGTSLASMFLLITCIGLQGSADSQNSKSSAGVPSPVFWMNTPLSLGMDSFKIEPSDKKLYLLACIEDRRFDRLQVSRVPSSPFVIDAAGKVWRNYPNEITFRVTATGINEQFVGMDSYDIKEKTDFNQLLLGLRFRLKAYRWLDMQIREPEQVKMIGMPADVPYNERVFRVTFNTGDLPVDDRLVLEVLTPDGKLLSRFHLELL